MKRIALLFVLCAVAAAQPPSAIPSGLSGSNYQTAVNAWFSYLNTNKSPTSHLHTGVYAPLSHVHIIADITGLQAALDGASGTPGGSIGQLQFNDSGAFGGVSNITAAQLPASTITTTGASTSTQSALMCLDRTVGYSSDLNQSALTFNVALGTFPAHFIFTDVWARETTTFAAPVDTVLQVSVGSAAHPDYLMAPVNLMVATNTVAGAAPSVPALTDSTIAIVAAFTVLTGGQNLSTYTAGSWDVRICGHLGR